MNELTPMGGTPYQMKFVPEFITSKSSYRDFADKPAEFLKFLITSAGTMNFGGDGTVGQPGDSNLQAFRNNVNKEGDNHIIPLFSLENISMNGENGRATECLASHGVPCSEKTCCSGVTLTKKN